MTTLTDMEFDVSTLYVSAIDVTPVAVESWSDLAGEDMDGFTFWESFTYEGGDGSFDLVASGSSVVGVVIDGRMYESFEEYADDWRDMHGGDLEDEDGEAITEATWDELMQVEPYLWGAEGPMMNYWYPLEVDEDRAPGLAANLHDVPLCVVLVNGSVGLALTGGGMDLSWDICKAFIVAGYLPPAHFANLPSYAGEAGDPIVLAAMRRTLEVREWQAQSALERLDNTFGSAS